MKPNNPIITTLILAVAVCSLITNVPTITQAQPGTSVSISNDFLPYQNFDEPIMLGDSSYVNNAQVQLKKMKARSN